MSDDGETIRWPTDLDRTAIDERLAKVREAALIAGCIEISSRFDDPRRMSAPQIASNVVGALTWLFNLPADKRPHGYEAITRQLEMVALNLKNLK